MKPGQKHIPELLAPAGNMEKLITAIRYGADAVYLGGRDLNLRAGAAGFTLEELPDALSMAHEAGVKVYFTLNAFPREDMLSRLDGYLKVLADLKPDAIIAADPGVIDMVMRDVPGVPVHVSTQANTANSAAVAFWQRLGAKRVNVAREVRSQELLQMLAICRKELRDMDLEIFIHGAQCMAISGRCYMSAYLNDRPGNLGQCSHPCRYEYQPTSIMVEERTRPGDDCWEVREFKYGDDGDTFTFEEGSDFPAPDTVEGALEAGVPQALDSGAYTTFFAAQDLCLLHYLEWFSRMGVASVKIEGRTKSSAYLAQVVDAYRTALDHIKSGEFQPELYLSELVNAASRPLTTGFFDPSRTAPIAQPPDKEERRPVLARIVGKREDGSWDIEVKSRWTTSGKVEILAPGMVRPLLRPDDYGIENDLGQGLEIAHPGMRCILFCDHPELDENLFIRQAWDLDDL